MGSASQSIFGPNNSKVLNMAYTNIVSQPETALTEFNELIFSYGVTNFYEGVTYQPVDFGENFTLLDGSYGIDAGVQIFNFDPIDGWSSNWPEDELDAHQYNFYENPYFLIGIFFQ